MICIMVYLKTEIESASREASHRSNHMSRDYAGFLKISEYIEAKASKDSAARCHCDNPFVYEIVASFYLPLQYLSMPDVNTASDL